MTGSGASTGLGFGLAGMSFPHACCVASCLIRTDAKREMAEGGSRHASAQPGPP